MIIFNLDGTLADCEHRRHFVDPEKNSDFFQTIKTDRDFDISKKLINQRIWRHKTTGANFIPDWQAFYEACDKDEPIKEVLKIMLRIDTPYQIWSGRCESIREKTEKWLCQFMNRSEIPEIKMRPIGDDSPKHVLKETWYDLHNVQHPRNNIDFVFDSDPKSITMWRRRGVFVFDCNQKGGEF